MRIRKAILPAGGLGTRLAPLTGLMPKEMLPLGEHVVLQHVIRECDAAGLDRLLVILNRRKTVLFPVGEETPCPTDPETGIPTRQVYFANQERQAGLAHALLHGEGFVGDESFVVALGDTVLWGEGEPLLTRMIDAHLAHGAAATVALEEVPPDRISRYGVADPAGVADGEVIPLRGVVEKPEPTAAPSSLAVAARYVLSPEVFAACRAAPRSPTGEMELTAALTLLARAGRIVLGVRLRRGERRLDIGSPGSYAEAFRTVTNTT